MRAFVAISLPEELKNKVWQIQQELRTCGLDCKWIKPQNIHLTLKFLGEVKEEKVNEIKQTIETTAKEFKAFKVSFKKFGFFPGEKNPRVFFVDTDNEDNLKNIASALSPGENRFKSHITLARLKSRKNIDCLKRKIKDIVFEESFEVKEITLFKSKLNAQGPIYEKIFTSSLTT
jgi:2'-5' RNA ligase